jgi:hypothetical protein
VLDKLEITGQNQSRIFNSRCGRSSVPCAFGTTRKQPSLKLKTQPKQLGGSLPLAFALSATFFCLAALNQNVSEHYVQLEDEAAFTLARFCHENSDSGWTPLGCLGRAIPWLQGQEPRSRGKYNP